jgi:hypothetical protein
MSAIPMTHDDYTVAWICALPLEAAASKAMLDKTHPQLSQLPNDDNAYTLGEISGHNIAIACLPSGTTAATTVAANMRTTFPSIHFGLMAESGEEFQVRIMIFGWAMWWSVSLPASGME